MLKIREYIKSFWDLKFPNGRKEADEAINLEDSFSDKEQSYPGTTQWCTIKEILRRIHFTVLCVAKGLSPGTTQRDT